MEHPGANAVKAEALQRCSFSAKSSLRCHAQAGFLANGFLRRDRSRRTRPTHAFPGFQPGGLLRVVLPKHSGGSAADSNGLPFSPVSGT